MIDLRLEYHKYFLIILVLSLILIPSLQISEARKYQMKSVPTYPPKDYTKKITKDYTNITKHIEEKQTVKQKIEQSQKPIKLNLIS